jgi:amidase
MKGEPANGWDKVNRTLWDKTKIDRNVYVGSPMAIQVVVPRLQERRLVDAMGIINRAVHGEGRVTNGAKL